LQLAYFTQYDYLQLNKIEHAIYVKKTVVLNKV